RCLPLDISLVRERLQVLGNGLRGLDPEALADLSDAGLVGVLAEVVDEVIEDTALDLRQWFGHRPSSSGNRRIRGPRASPAEKLGLAPSPVNRGVRRPIGLSGRWWRQRCGPGSRPGRAARLPDESRDSLRSP